MADFYIKTCGNLKEIQNLAENKMRRVWVMDTEFSANCEYKASFLYYRVLTRALKEADLPYSNGFNDYI